MNGICTLSIVPCRKSPSSKSEMTTQLLFGETFDVVGSEKEWLRILSHADGYESWVNKQQVQMLSEPDFSAINSSPAVYSADLVQIITNTGDGTMFPLVIGSTLPSYSGQTCRIGGVDYTYEGQTISPGKPWRDEILETAFMFLGAPYLWGGRSPFGIDCSGFTQIVYRLNGINLHRDAWQQAEQGEALSFVEEAVAGSLAFFDNEEGKITHVGILLDNHRIIHASGKVRIDRLDHHGIYNEETKQYSHKLRIIRSYF